MDTESAGDTAVSHKLNNIPHYSVKVNQEAIAFPGDLAYLFKTVLSLWPF